MSKFGVQQLFVCKAISLLGYGSRKVAWLSSGLMGRISPFLSVFFSLFSMGFRAGHFSRWVGVWLAGIALSHGIMPVQASESCKDVTSSTNVPSGCFCWGPSPKVVSNTEMRTDPGQSDASIITLSGSTTSTCGFTGFTDTNTHFLTQTSTCIDPECGTKHGVGVYTYTVTRIPNGTEDNPDNPPPEAILTVSPEEGTTPLKVSLDGSSSKGTIVSYEWLVDGKSVASSSTADYTFEEPNQHTVTLIVMSDKGLSDSDQKVVKVTPAKLEMLDPACSAQTTCNGDFLKETGESATVDESKLLSASVTRSGVVTDGVTQLLLRVKNSEAVTFTLGGNDSCQFGTLMQLDGSATSCDSLTVEPVKMDKDSYVFAAYRAPLNFPSDSSVPAKVSLEAKNASGEVLDTKELQLQPPPIMLVHGVWDVPKSWNNVFVPALKKGGYKVYPVGHNYGEFPASGTFDPQLANSVAIPQLVAKTQEAIKNFRTQGIAVSQVDVVAHSMGGLITRATVKTQNYGYQYNRIDNYKKGDFHKIITIGTPHQGTRIADVLVHGKCRERELNCKPKWNLGIIPPIQLAMECQPERLETTMANLDHVIGPAVYGFQTGSTAIKNIGDTLVPSHAIVGIAPTGTSFRDISSLEVVLDKMFDFYAFKTVDELSTVDDILGGNANHDTIVPIESQQGGLSGSAITTFNNVDHLGEIGAFGGSVAPEIANKVLELLRESPDSSTFGHFTALPQQAGNSDVNFEADRNRCETQTATTKSSLRDNPVSKAIISFEPVPGTVVTPGQKVKVSLDITGGDVQDGAMISIEGQLIGLEGAPPWVVDYTVPENAGGKINIYVQTTNGDLNTEAYAVESYLIVKLPEMDANTTTDTVAFNSEGNVTETQAVFSGGISVDGGPFKKVIEFGDNLEHGAGAQSVTVKGIIIPDPKHDGKSADIFAFGEYTPYGDDLNDTTCPTQVANPEAVPFYVMESLPKNYVTWEGAKTPSSIPAFLYKNVLLKSGEAQEFILFEGPFDARGCLSISFGYRLQDSGVVVYNHHTATVDNGIGVTVRKK